jgi:hypothetical protein
MLNRPFGTLGLFMIHFPEINFWAIFKCPFGTEKVGTFFGLVLG